MTQPPSVQYIQVKDAFGVQWLMNPDTQLKSKRPEDAKAFCAVEAQKVFTDLTRLGFKGLAIVDELPSDRKMHNRTRSEATAKPPYFVAATSLGSPASSHWVKTKAKTIDGAKRLATKLPRGTAATARVAIENAKGEFETIATFEDYSAITRCRPTWKTHQPTGRASA